MIFKKNIYNLFISSMGLLVLILLASCSINDEVKEVDENNTYQLLISLSFADKGTRAIDPVFTDGSEDENYIGNPTFALYYEGSFLMDLTKWFTMGDKYVMLISSDEFDEAFSKLKNQQFDPDWLEEEAFQVLATANSSTDNRYSFSGRLTDLWSNTKDYNFISKIDNSGKAWLPSVQTEEGIPMFGLSTMGKFSNREFEVNIPMLRALAKLEIIDAMKVIATNYPFTIGDVTLSKSSASGRLIPDGSKNPGWNVETTQVATPSLPDKLTATEGIIMAKTSEELTYLDITSEFNKWICYVPEMDLMDENFGDAVFKVGLNENETDAKLSLKNAILEMTGKNYVLRNQKYSFFITGLKDIDNEFEVKVDPFPGDVNFIYYGGNKWWIHKEKEENAEIEVWYKFISGSDGKPGYWEKEWRYMNGFWQRWDGEFWEETASQDGPFEN